MARLARSVDYQAIRRSGAPTCVDCDGPAEAVVQAEEWFGGLQEATARALRRRHR